jgi:hypothetical protein
MMVLGAPSALHFLQSLGLNRSSFEVLGYDAERFVMSEVLDSLLSAVKPRPQRAKREMESVSRFVLDEAKFFADIVDERWTPLPPIRPGIGAAAAAG